MSQTLIYIGGCFILAFAAFHLAFWRLFEWKTQLPKLNAINRGVMPVLNLCLTFVFLVFAFVSFCFAAELVTTALGRTLLAAISLFWFLRAAMQPVFWKFNDKISVAFFVIFLAGGTIYLLPLVL